MAVVTSFAEFHNLLGPWLDDRRWCYRGQRDPTWRLIPKAGRPPYNVREPERHKVWKGQALEHVTPIGWSDWEWMATAQHHGLATRLLDWTTNPLVAAYFAVCDQTYSGDSVVFAHYTDGAVDMTRVDPLDVRGIVRWRSPRINTRLSRQAGLFTVHGPSSADLRLPRRGHVVEEITIAKGYRKRFLVELHAFGIDTRSLFPDLDGLARHLNWVDESRHFPVAKSTSRSRKRPTKKGASP